MPFLSAFDTLSLLPESRGLPLLHSAHYFQEQKCHDYSFTSNEQNKTGWLALLRLWRLQPKSEKPRGVTVKPGALTWTYMGSNAIGERWYKSHGAIFLTALYFNRQKINNIKTEGHSLWKELHQCKNRTDKAKRDYNRRYPKGQMKSWVTMFLKTEKSYSLNETSSVSPPSFSQFF